MVAYLLIFAVSIVLFFYIRSSITRQHLAEREDVKQKYLETLKEYELLRADYEQLNQERLGLVTELNRMRNGESETRTTAAKINRSKEKKPKETDSDRIGDYLLASGMVTLEQFERASGTMRTMQLDLLDTCLTLGFISADEASAVRERFPSN